MPKGVKKVKAADGFTKILSYNDHQTKMVITEVDNVSSVEITNLTTNKTVVIEPKLFSAVKQMFSVATKLNYVPEETEDDDLLASIAAA